jgi:hypothetical protein
MIPLSDLAKWDQDALTTLQKVYSDPKAHQSDWLKAASAAIAYERGKPASVVVQVDSPLPCQPLFGSHWTDHSVPLPPTPSVKPR